jgi:inner membrane transporter RhtA
MVALKHLPQHTFSILLSLEPAVGAMAGWIVLSEHLSPGQWAAMGFIICASMGSAWSAGRSKH